MKKLLFLSLIIGALNASAQKISPITIGIDKVADSVAITVLSFETSDKKCRLYYRIFSNNKNQIDSGTLEVSEKEFCLWGKENLYIEDLALTKLKLTRKIK